ncbi:hypothetical protein T492DRAFT_880251 [Pavlovales sp. CCMP2436]|nr:hypothetical protein T492DRAFT_880251 [Pavlovales sp. CCMP2436]
MSSPTGEDPPAGPENDGVMTEKVLRAWHEQLTAYASQLAEVRYSGWRSNALASVHSELVRETALRMPAAEMRALRAENSALVAQLDEARGSARRADAERAVLRAEVRDVEAAPIPGAGAALQRELGEARHAAQRAQAERKHRAVVAQLSRNAGWSEAAARSEADELSVERDAANTAWRAMGSELRVLEGRLAEIYQGVDGKGADAAAKLVTAMVENERLRDRLASADERARELSEQTKRLGLMQQLARSNRPDVTISQLEALRHHAAELEGAVARRDDHAADLARRLDAAEATALRVPRAEAEARAYGAQLELATDASQRAAAAHAAAVRERERARAHAAALEAQLHARSARARDAARPEEVLAPSADVLAGRARPVAGGALPQGALETRVGAAVKGGGRVAVALPLDRPPTGAAAAASRRAARAGTHGGGGGGAGEQAARRAAGAGALLRLGGRARATRVAAPDPQQRAAAAAAAGVAAVAAPRAVVDTGGGEALARAAERRARAAAERIAMDAAAMADARVGLAEKKLRHGTANAFAAIVGSVVHARAVCVLALAFDKWACLLSLGAVHAAGVWQAALVFTDGSAQLLTGLDALRGESVALLVQQPVLLDRLAAVRSRVDSARREASLVHAELRALASTPGLLLEVEAELAAEQRGRGAGVGQGLGAALGEALEAQVAGGPEGQEDGRLLRLREAAARGLLSRELLHLLAPTAAGIGGFGTDAAALAESALSAEARRRRAAEAEAERLDALLAEHGRRAAGQAEATVVAALAAAEARHSRERRLRERAQDSALAVAKAAHAEERLVLATALAVLQARAAGEYPLSPALTQPVPRLR